MLQIWFSFLQASQLNIVCMTHYLWEKILPGHFLYPSSDQQPDLLWHRKGRSCLVKLLLWFQHWLHQEFQW
jgi:hypothetical protein